MELTHFMVASNKSFYENQQIHLLSIASYLDKEIKAKGPKPNLITYFTWAKIVYLYYMSNPEQTCMQQLFSSQTHKLESFTTSSTDRHLLRQRISVMTTNAGVFVVFKTKHELKCQFSGNIECVCFHY